MVFLALSMAATLGLAIHRYSTRTDLTPRKLALQKLDGGRLELGHAILRPNLPGNPTVEFFYAVPMDHTTGRPRATASTMLFFAPFLNEDRILRKYGLRDEQLEFARRYGWSVFTLAIAGNRHVDDHQAGSYIFPEAGWPSVVFEMKSWLEGRYGLSPKRLVVAGESDGGSMAEHMAVAFPEQVAAAAWNGGGSYAEIPPESPVAFFSFSTWGCPGKAASRKLSRMADEHGVQVLWEEGPPISHPFDATHHGASTIAVRLRRLFLKGVMDLADAEGRVPPPEEWPVSFRQPDGQVLHFPSMEFSSQWESLPLELNQAAREGWTGGHVEVIRPVASPKRNLVFFTDCDDIRLRDTVYAMNCADCAVFVVFCGQGTEQAGHDGRALLADIQRRSSLARLPLSIVAEGAGAVPALRMAVEQTQGAHSTLLLDPLGTPEAGFTPLALQAIAQGIDVRAFVSPGMFLEDCPGVSALPMPSSQTQMAEWFGFLGRLFAELP